MRLQATGSNYGAYTPEERSNIKTNSNGRTPVVPIGQDNQDSASKGTARGGESLSSICSLGSPGGHSNLDIVQMSSPLYFVEESERKFEVDIMRLGNLQGKCKVQYYTEDATAIAGERYRAAQGELVFRDGEHTKPIELFVIQSDQWASTLEFKIHLRNPENCEIGQYLHFARVKIIDNDMFPSSKYEEELHEGEEGIEKIPGLRLMVEYFRLNMSNQGIFSRTWLIFFMDQLHNIYKFIILKIQIYLVDVLFNVDEAREKDEDVWLKMGPERGRIYTARLVAALYIVPMVALHLWDVYKVHLDLEGLSREYLQVNLFRKYLNYSEESRQKVPPSHMQVAIVQDCDEVAESYSSFLNLLQVIGKLIIVTYFILVENPDALVSVLLMPAFMLTFAFFRSGYMIAITEHVAERTAEVISVVNEATLKYSLIADYQQRPQFCELFQERSKELSEARLPMDKMKVNSNYAPKWLGPVFTGIYIAMYAQEVLSPEGKLPLGVFLATVRVFGELAENFEGAYEELMEITGAIGPLRKLTYYFNLETNLKKWKDVNRQRRELTKIARLEVMHSDDKDAEDRKRRPRGSKALQSPASAPISFRTDQITLKVRGVSFMYNDGPYMLRNVNVEVAQGNLVAVVGQHGSGKGTLLRLIGHNIFPTEGRIFIPTHLRILHVPEGHQILNLNAWRNLTFGRHQAVPKRVGYILKSMSMQATLDLVRQDLKALGREGELHYDELMRVSKEQGSQSGSGEHDSDDDPDDAEESAEEIEEDEEKDGVVPWQDMLSASEKNKIQLARALIVNPEVLVLHRPITNYDTKTANTMMRIIREHVDNRGFQVSVHTCARRRPRTCFFSPTNEEQMLKADRVWFVYKGGVYDMSPEELAMFMRKKNLDFFAHA